VIYQHNDCLLLFFLWHIYGRKITTFPIYLTADCWSPNLWDLLHYLIVRFTAYHKIILVTNSSNACYILRFVFCLKSIASRALCTGQLQSEVYTHKTASKNIIRDAICFIFTQFLLLRIVGVGLGGLIRTGRPVPIRNANKIFSLTFKGYISFHIHIQSGPKSGTPVSILR